MSNTGIPKQLPLLILFVSLATIGTGLLLWYFLGSKDFRSDWDEDIEVDVENFPQNPVTPLATGTIRIVCATQRIGCDYIGGDGLQLAVNDAVDGDTILIKSGGYIRNLYSEFTYTAADSRVYRHRVFLNIGNKAITIQGEGTVILNGAISLEMSGIAKNGPKETIIKNIRVQGFKKTTSSCSFTTNFCSSGTGILVAGDGNLSIEKAIIQNNAGNGMYFTNTAIATVKSSIIRYTIGNVIDEDASATLINNIINNNVYEGVNIEDGITVVLTNNTIVNNHGGGKPGGVSIYRSPDVTITNNIIANNLAVGIYVHLGEDESKYTGTLTVDYNDVWNNTDGNYVGTAPGTNGISENPLFISTSDLHLQTTPVVSPAIDTGDPTLLDPDGTRSDMGAYGGPDSCSLDSSLTGCPACVPACEGKVCDPDGCGGTCGTCTSPLVCSAAGQCVCAPDCTGKVCGPDGCGGTCGTCEFPAAVCNASGTCDCTPVCNGKVCGDNSCGGTCGTCPTGQTCNSSGACVCAPSCSGKECGNDGCGGSCGTCTAPETCNASGICACTPQCTDKVCGADDGCGGKCTACPTGQTCNTTTWACQTTCTPICTGKECGSDGCTGSCGTCTSPEVCNAEGACAIPSIPGDLNGDGRVSVADYALFIQDYLAYLHDGTVNPRSDFNTDNAITVSDYALFITAYLNFIAGDY